MPTQDDIQFVKMALSKKLLATEQVGECLKILKTLEEHTAKQGAEKIGVEKVVLDKHYLTAEQVEEILESLHKKIWRCQNCNAKYRIDDSKSKKERKCVKCGGILVVSERTPTTTEEGMSATAETVLREQGSKGGAVEDHDKSDTPQVTTQDAYDPLVGQELAGYEVLEKIGEGGMGAIYRARNIGLDRIVALKLLPSSLIEKSRQYVDRFLTEARAAARLNHPNAVAVYRVDEVDDQHFIEMEFVEGKTLKDLVKERGPFDPEEASRILKQAAAALDAAHDKSIIHRDIKPDNIMVTTNGEVKVTDFGLAKNIAADSELTDIGQMLGTPAYMSPEQCDGKPADARSDVYSLGATFFYMLSGNHPFMGETPIATMYKHKHEPVPNITELNPNVPDAFRAVIEKIMAKNPDERYQTGTELIESLNAAEAPLPDDAYVLPAEELEAIEAKSSHTPSEDISPSAVSVEGAATPHPETQTPLPQPRWTPFRIGIALISVLIVVLTIGVLFSGRGDEQSPQTGQLQTERSSGRRRAKSEIEKHYNAAIEFAEKDPENYSEIIERFSDIAIAAKGTKFSQMAEAKKKDWEAKHKEAVEKKLAENKQMADNFAAEKRFQKAIDVYNEFPWAWETDEVEKKIEDQRSYYENKANKAFGQVVDKVSGLIEDRKFDEAKAQLEEARVFGTAQVISSIENWLRRIENLSRHKENLEHELVEAEKIYSEALNAFKNRDYIGARRRLRDIEVDVKRAVLRKLIAEHPFIVQMKEWLEKRGNLITVKQDGGGEFRTVCAALSAAENGATILIHGGEYEEPFDKRRTFKKEGIVLRGAAGSMPTIETVEPIVCGADWKIADLDFRGEGTAIKTSSGSISIERCRFTGYGKQVILIEGYVSGVKVENCVFYRNQPGCVVELINLSAAGELVFENNTLHLNGGIIHHAGVGQNWRVTIENNIFSEITQPYRHGRPGGLTEWQADCNYYFRLKGPFLTFLRGIKRPRIMSSRLPIQKQIQELQRMLRSKIEEHSIFASPNKNPNFVNAAKGDFHLQRLSPCHNKGKDGKDFGVQWNETEKRQEDANHLPPPPSPP